MNNTLDQILWVCFGLNVAAAALYLFNVILLNLKK